MYDGAPWPDGCITASRPQGHTEVPAKDCTCGVYAYYDPCPRTASAATADLIGGAAVLWGRIEAHMYGLRGTHARIVALELPAVTWAQAARGRRGCRAGGGAGRAAPRR